MKIDPRHLETLAAIVNNGGLTEGAQALGRSQPSVSRTLALLEDRIGEKLFLPGRKPLQPTELCRLIAREGVRVAEAGQAASKVVAQYQDGKTGAVRIGGTPIFMDGVISRIIASFQSGHREVRIDQSYGYRDSLLDGLTRGALDLAVTPMRPEDVPDGLSFDQLMPGRNVITCSARHPLARKKSLRVADIAEYPWIAPPSDSPLYHDMRAVLDGIGVSDFRVNFTGGSLSSVLELLEASDALTVLPYSVYYLTRSRRPISALSIRIGDPDRHLGLLSRTSDAPKPSVVRFRRYVQTEVENLKTAMELRDRDSLWRR